MGQLKIKIKAKIQISFERLNATFLRGEETEKTLIVSYTNGTGQELIQGQVLYLAGTEEQEGFIKIEVLEDTVLMNSGTFEILFKVFPSNTELSPKIISFNIDNNPVLIDIYYTSNPTTSNISVETPNRTIYTITQLDILSGVNSYDNTTITEVSLIGDTTGITYEDSSYTSNTFIPLTALSEGKLKYIPNDTDDYYEYNIQYKVKDINGNIST